MITVAAGQPIRSTHVNQFTRWITGQTKDLSFTPITTSPTDYTATLTNEDTSAGLMLKGVFGNTTAFTFNKTGATFNIPIIASNPLAGLFSATGQIIYGSGGTAAATLNIGSTFQTLYASASGVPFWGVSPVSTLTAQGDLLGTSSANNMTRIPKGTAFQEFIMNPGATGQTWATGFLASVQTEGDLIYGASTNVAARLGRGTNGTFLTLSGGLPAWTSISPGSELANLLTSTGDMAYASAPNTAARLAVGTNRQIMRSNGTVPSWGDTAWVVIGSTVLTTQAASIVFTAVPQTYRALHVMWRSRDAGAGTGVSSMLMQFNGDTGNNYDYQLDAASVSTSAGVESLAGSAIRIGSGVNGGAATQCFGIGAVSLPNYVSTTGHREAVYVAGAKFTATSGGMSSVNGMGYWRNTAAITSVTLFISGNDMVAGSYAALYGVPQ